MAYGIFGNSAIDRASVRGSGVTLIIRTPVAPNRGIVKEIRIFSAGNLTINVKFFRDDGTNYIYLGQMANVLCVAGLNIIPAWFPVERNDLLGFYCTTNNILDVDTSGGDEVWQGGDITSNTTKASWNFQGFIDSVGARVFARVAPL